MAEEGTSSALAMLNNRLQELAGGVVELQEAVANRDARVSMLEQMLQQQIEINAQSAAVVTTPNPTLSRMLGQLRLEVCKWDGDRRQDIGQWFFQIERFLRLMPGISASESILFASLNFIGPALVWWRAIENGNRVPVTWLEFKALVTKEYKNDTRVGTARDKLASARMTGSLANFMAYSRSLHFEIPDIADGEKQHRFLCGLVPRLQEKVRAARPPPQSFEEMVQLATMFDDAERATHRNGRGFGSHFSFRAPLDAGPSRAVTHSRPGNDAAQVPMELGAVAAQGTRQPRDISNDRCYNCHEKGHHAKDCKKKTFRRHQGQQGSSNGNAGSYKRR
jgi:hypothetical protein